MDYDIPLNKKKERPENKIPTLFAESWKDYEVLDSGGGKRLERFGEVILIRPDSTALWEPLLTPGEWSSLSWAEYRERGSLRGDWYIRKDPPKAWVVEYPLEKSKIHFNLKLTPFKHVGIFPEQSVNWQYLNEKMRQGMKLLNLFAYTGGSSQAAALSGADVTHIDSVYTMVGWARENAKEAGLGRIRWICEDSVTFVTKEVRRGNRYDMIILDPPTFGRSGKGKTWKIERDLFPLLKTLERLLPPQGQIILNCYSPRIDRTTLISQLERFSLSYKLYRHILLDRGGRELECGYLIRIDSSLA